MPPASCLEVEATVPRSGCLSVSSNTEQLGTWNVNFKDQVSPSTGLYTGMAMV